MDFVWVVLGIAVVAVLLYLAATMVFGPGEPPTPAGEDLASPLPAGREMTAEDLRAATFPVTARGYRMSDVDALIERMAHQLERSEHSAGQGERLAESASHLSSHQSPDDPPGDAGSADAPHPDHAPKHQA